MTQIRYVVFLRFFEAATGQAPRAADLSCCCTCASTVSFAAD